MESHQTKRAVIYCRVSTKEQVEEGNSLVTQEKHCREFAHKNGYEIAVIFIEQGESAKTANRTELKKLMAFCAGKKNNINAVIAYKLDRISRNTDDYSQIRILLKRYGVEIKSTSEYFENTPAGRFMENIIANVAQFDNDVRAERCIGGMRDAAKEEGRYVWRAPMGYDNAKVNGKSTIVLNNFAAIIKATFEEVALNRYPLTEVRRLMAKKGLRGKNGKPLSQSYFYTLLKNEVYAGIINKFGERYKGLFEPIVEETLFWRVQEILNGGKKKRKSFSKSFSPDFPLRRFLIHKNGRMLTGYWANGRYKKYPYYTFHRTKILFKRDELEHTFAKWLNQFRMSTIKFDDLYNRLKSLLNVTNNSADKMKEHLSKQLEILKSKQSILVDKNIAGIIDDEIFKMKSREINSEIYQITQELQTLPEKLVLTEELLRITREALMNPGEIWLNSPSKTRVKLQWFYCPHGLEYSENESRTTEICNIFKGTLNILPLFSSTVHHRKSKSNTTDSRIPKEPSVETLVQEIQKLADIIQDKKSDDEFP